MTPDLPEHPTDLTPEQRTYLVGLREFVGNPPSATRLYARIMPRVVLLTVWFFGLTGAAWVYEAYWAMWFSLGMLTGFLLLVVGNVRRSVRLWPVSAAILDWKRLDELLGEYAPDRDRP
ncbi:hypothetical protein J0H58_01615 [bacterium]|nr:hypothetical protein [bacterium]